jgi:hypothetical protein
MPLANMVRLRFLAPLRFARNDMCGSAPRHNIGGTAARSGRCGHAFLYILAILIAGSILLVPAAVFAGELAEDGFEDGSFSDGTGWSGSWQTSGAADVVNSGDAQVGSRHMRLLSGNGVAYRDLDLAGVGSPVLTVWVRAASFEGSEYARLRVGPPGSLTEVKRWVDDPDDGNEDEDDNEYHLYSFDLSDFDTSDAFRIQFESHMGSSNDYLYVDAVTVSGDPPPTEPVIPILECVTDNGDGSYTAYFGYENENAYNVTIPVGPDNMFTPSPQDRGQPSLFESGITPEYPDTAFSVDFDASSLTWTLDGQTSTASSSSPQCPEPGDSSPGGPSASIIALDGEFDDWDGHASITDPEGDSRKDRGDILAFYWGDNPDDENVYWMVERPSHEWKLVRYSVHLDMNNDGGFDGEVDRIVEVLYQPGFFRSWVIVKVRHADSNQPISIELLKDWGETIGEDGSRVEFSASFEDLGFSIGGPSGCTSRATGMTAHPTPATYSGRPCPYSAI